MSECEINEIEKYKGFPFLLARFRVDGNKSYDFIDSSFILYYQSPNHENQLNPHWLQYYVEKSRAGK